MDDKINIYARDSAILAGALDKVIFTILLNRKKLELKSFLFCGSEPGAGSTSLTIDIAVSLSKAGWKTVLVDADLRKDTRYKRLSKPDGLGLSDYLQHKAGLDQIVVPTTQSKLEVIPSGSMCGNPMALLCSSELGSLLDDLRKSYDFIIIDSPALNSSTDANVLAAAADGTIMVVAYGISSSEILRNNCEGLKRQEANLLGVVFNQADSDIYRQYQKNYDYFYRKRYKKRPRTAERPLKGAKITNEKTQSCFSHYDSSDGDADGRLRGEGAGRNRR